MKKLCVNAINRKCKYCGQNLKYDYIINEGMCVFCDNSNCAVKPITDYNFASSELFQKEIDLISSDKWKE
mgnify:FL=1